MEGKIINKYLQSEEFKAISDDLKIMQKKWNEKKFSKGEIENDLREYLDDKNLPSVIPHSRNLNSYFPRYSECTKNIFREVWINLNKNIIHSGFRSKLFSNKEKEIEVIACVWLNNENLCENFCRKSKNCEKDFPDLVKVMNTYYVAEGRHRTYAHFILGYKKMKVNIIEYQYGDISNKYILSVIDTGRYEFLKKDQSENFSLGVSTYQDDFNKKSLSNLNKININIIDKRTENKMDKKEKSFSNIINKFFNLF